MNWKEYIQSIAMTPRLGLLTLATTGLDPMKGDELIGVAVHIFEEDGNDTDCGHLLRLVTVENLQKSMDYHKVSQQQIVREGYDHKTWGFELDRMVTQMPVCWFTYNPQFAETFLESAGVKWRMHDFTKLLMFAESRLPFEDWGSIFHMDRFMDKQRKAPGIRTLAGTCGEICEPAPGELPMTAMLRVLCHMARKMFEIECPVTREQAGQ